MRIVAEQAHVTLGGDIIGEYLVEDRRPDGRLVLVPDTGIEAIRKRHGLAPASLAEFEAEYGPVQPADGEESSVNAILARHDAKPLSQEDFERHFGDLSKDDDS